MRARTRAESPRTISWPGGSARLAPWRGCRDVGQVISAVDTPMPTGVVDELVATARPLGYHELVTGALNPTQARPFVERGFTSREDLHLLAHPTARSADVTRPGACDGYRIERASRRDHDAVLRLDGVSFDERWRLDRDGLRDALSATPVSRFRIGRDDSADGIAAYAITGRFGTEGYLQRLAVHPAARRHGWGRALITDTLTWLRRAGARRTLVNTQLGNDAARSLYESMGFELLPERLSILELAL